MKKIILLIILFFGTKNFAQTKGITYQAVILNPSGEQLPGVNNTNSPMVDKKICLQFRFIDEFSNIEYQETIETKTDQFGMVNLIIGTGNQTAGYAVSFETMEWNALKKSLIVGINTDGSCSSFTEISDQPFTAVPFAFSAINAGNVTGVVDIQNGGTNAITVVGAKTNLGLENVDNTSDLDKSMSIAAQAGWNINSNAIAGVQTDVDNNETASTTSDATLQTNIEAVETIVTDNNTATTNAIAGVQTNVAANETASNTADATLQTNIDNLTTATSDDNTALQSELDLTQTGAGLNADGTYSAI